MRYLLVAVLLSLASLGSARDLPVPADKGWQHAQTGLIVMPQIAGFRRTALTDNTATEHDVAAQFGEDAEGTFTTLYLFRPAIADAALWFDRAQAALDAGKTGRGAAPATIDPTLFAPPGASVASGIRQVYSSAGGPFRSTAVAVVPLGDWLVKVRMTSATLTADKLDARLMAFIAGLRWPAATNAALATAPIRPCDTPMAAGKAKVVKAVDAGSLLALLLPGIAAKQPAAERGPPAVWCREGEGLAEYAAYRANGEPTSYVIAMYDAGRVVRVQPPILAGTSDKTVTVALEDVDGTVSAYPSFSALPKPAQVWKLLSEARPTSRKTGDQITVDAGAR